MPTTPKTDSSSGHGTTPPPPIEYGYMFATDKSPSTQLDALLRAISFHVARDIGDKDIHCLTPQKLAAFYKAVGGDYDSLFVSMPDSAISYMWQVTGCQHSLQPAKNDFDPPSIPALTPRGFSRWESLEILLGPEEHVPFLQFAVKNWNLKHPDTGQPFPPELPKTVFPSEPDADVDRWHQSCAKKLEGGGTERQKEAQRPASASEPTSEQPKFTYSHVRGSFPGSRPSPREAPYFERPERSERPERHGERPERSERPVPFSHVPGRSFGGSRRSPERVYNESRFDQQGRRKSFSDYNISPHSDKSPYGPGGTYLDPNSSAQRPPTTRRHSQPRHASESSDDETPPSRRRPAERSPPKSPPRRHAPTSDPQSGPDGRPSSSYRPHRSEIKGDDMRRRPTHSPSLREKVTDKVSNLFTNGPSQERPRPSQRTSYSETSRPRRSRDRPPPSRLHKSLSDLDSNNSSDQADSEDEARARRARNERERERKYRERERERERDEERRDRAYLRRPDMERRASSHADMERRRDSQQLDPRSTRDDRRRWDRRAPDEDREPSMMGVGGRRYPETAYS